MLRRFRMGLEVSTAALSASTALDALLALGVGRTLLSLLPPGRVGSHRPRELPETVIASLALGAWTVVAARRLGVAWSGSRDALVLGLALAAALVGAVRLATRPHAFVPQHVLPEPRRNLLTFVWLGLVALDSLEPVWSDATAQSASLSLLALAAAWIVFRALECAGQPAWIAALCASLLPLDSRESLDSAGLSLIVALLCAGLVGWLRRADARDRAIAALAAAASVAFDARIALAGGVALWVTAHRNSRKASVKALVVASLAVGVPTWLVLSGESASWSTPWSVSTDATPLKRWLPFAMGALALALGVIFARRPRSASPAEFFAPAGKELVALAVVWILPIALAGLARLVPALHHASFARADVAALARALVPAAVMFAALACVRSVRP
jgi:hypothetical protein